METNESILGSPGSSELVVSSTFFPRNNIHKHKCSALDGRTKTEIDHVIIDKCHHSSIINVRTYRVVNGDLDYYLVVAKFSLKLTGEWKRHQQKSKNGKLDRKE